MKERLDGSTEMSAKILFRPDQDNIEEFDACKKVFGTENVHTQRYDACGAKVIGRYSVLPYYQELCIDLSRRGSRLINSDLNHLYVADFRYYEDLNHCTFKTYFNPRELPEGKYVVKGKTNSRKSKWNTLMFADSRKKAIEIGHELMTDPLIAPQGVIYREYVPLRFIEEGLHGQPFVNEHRFFFLNGQMVDYGFYWSQAETEGILTDEGIELAYQVAHITRNKIPFVCIDIAELIVTGKP